MTQVTEKKLKDMDHAIECPKCHDFIILSSDFDRFCYICDECDFSLPVTGMPADNKGPADV
jgi:hypothetical protein